MRSNWHRKSAATMAALSLQLLAGCMAQVDDGEFEEDDLSAQEGTEVQGTELAIKNGYALPTGQLEAVGMLPGCSATLIDHQIVLTAAHCVCPSDSSPVGCSARTTFTLNNVKPVDNPATGVNESLTRRNVSIGGTVHVHPSYGAAGWLRSDYAVVVLDRPAYKHVVDVVPIPLATADRRPTTADSLLAIGFSSSNSDCSDAFGTKRSMLAKPIEVVAEAIRFSPIFICPGDSGGPLLDKTLAYVVGVASFVSGNQNTYRPAYEVYNWVEGIARPVREAAGADTFMVSSGLSNDLDAYKALYGYWPEVGIVAQDIASDNAVYTWYNNGTVTMGLSWSLDSSTRGTYKYTLPPGKTPADITEIAIASDDTVYTWYNDRTVSKGRTFDLDAIAAPTPYTLAPNQSPSTVVGIGIAKSTNWVYTWYKNGTVSVGRSWDLDSAVAPYPYSTAPGKSPASIVGMGIASDDHIYTWYGYSGAVFP